MKKTLSILFLSALSCSLVACGTMRGAGEDIEDAGEFVQDAAEDVSN